MFFKFIIHLLTIIVVAIVATSAVSYHMMTENAKKTAERYLVDEIEELYIKYEASSNSVHSLSKVNSQSMLARTRAAARIIRLTPSILQDPEELQKMCNSSYAESIIVCDAAGIVQASTPEDLVGTRLPQDYADLVACAKGRVYEKTMLAPSLDGSGQPCRFACVRRTDAPGVVIFAFYIEYEGMARVQSSAAELVTDASVGQDGFLIAFEKGEIFTITELPTTEAELRSLELNKLLEEEFNGTDYYVYAVYRNGLRLIAFVPTREYLSGRNNDFRLQVYSIILLILAILFTVYLLLKRHVLTPISRLDTSLKRIGSGHFDERVHITASQEFRKLSQSINIMLDSMRASEDLSIERNQHELSLARSIKEAVLPKPADVLATRTDCSLAISLEQADTVGGDFYDCQLVDDDHLLLVLGSITEDGVPAALYMMRGLAIIRNFVDENVTPVELAERINRHICTEDTADLQAAMFIGILQISTGDLVCVNAGQHTPMLQRDGEEYQALPVPSSPVLGQSKDSTYQSYAVTLTPGDRLFLCSASLVEITNEHKEHFGERRLTHALHEATPSAKDVPHVVRTAMRRFLRQGPRNKDYTIISLELPGPRRSGGSVIISAQDSKKALALIERSMEEVFAAPNDITAVLQAASSVIAAIPPEKQVRVVLGCTENHARVTLSYTGAEKNILHDLPDLQLGSAVYQHSENVNDIILHTTLG